MNFDNKSKESYKHVTSTLVNFFNEVIDKSDKVFIKKEDLDTVIKFIIESTAGNGNMVRAKSGILDGKKTFSVKFVGEGFLMNAIPKLTLNETSLDAIRTLDKWFYVEGRLSNGMDDLIEKCFSLLENTKLYFKGSMGIVQKDFIELIRLLNKLLTEDEILKNTAIEPFYNLNLNECWKVIYFSLGDTPYAISVKKDYSLATILRKIAHKIGVGYSMVSIHT